MDDYVRTEALESLLILLNHGVVSREQRVFYFKELFNGKLEVDYSSVWDELPRYCSLIHPKGLEKDMEKAVADGKVMEIIADLDFMNCQLKRPVKEVLDELKEDEDYSFVSEEDVYSLEGWVGGFSYEEDSVDEYSFDEDDEMEGDRFMSDFYSEYRDHETSVNLPFKRENFVGRNDPCPCGSGKKYKKCCLGKEEK